MQLINRITKFCFLSLFTAFDSQMFQQKQDDQPKEENYIVRPYYVYPADQDYFPEYEKAVNKVIVEIQEWYKKQVGITFKMAPLKVIKSKEDYMTMRGGEKPDMKRKDDKSYFSNWISALGKAIGGYKNKSVAWVFAQGGAGQAWGNLYGDYQGFGVFGDWVLEPISGVENPKGFPCKKYATWECKGGTPKGTTVHELGHGFGVHHPDGYPGKSIMLNHTEYPEIGLLPHEIMILKTSPFFTGTSPDPKAPFCGFETQDKAKWGDKLTVKGRGFKEEDVVEFVYYDYKSKKEGKKEVKAQNLSKDGLVVDVPKGVGPGYIRVKRDDLISNCVPINIYPN